MKRRSLLTLVASCLLLLSCTQSNTGDMRESEDSELSLLQRINDNGVITIGTEGTYPPFTYHDETGKLTGYDIEVARAVADRLGVKAEFREVQWSALLSGLEDKQFDMVANQVSLSSPERRAKYDTVIPYSWSGAVMLAPIEDTLYSSWDDLNGMRSAQSPSSEYSDIAVSFKATIVPVDTMTQALQAVEQTRADLTVNDQLAALDYLRRFPESGLEIKLIAPKSDQSGSGLVLLKGNNEVVSKLDDVMLELQADGTLSNLSQEFFANDITQRK